VAGQEEVLVQDQAGREAGPEVDQEDTPRRRLRP
jgi:hypothetical protein